MKAQQNFTCKDMHHCVVLCGMFMCALEREGGVGEYVCVSGHVHTFLHVSASLRDPREPNFWV